MKYLPKIDSPEALRKLKRSVLEDVCSELRHLIIKVVSEKGGHFGSNLGTVELSVALHYVLNTPKDKLVWDVGHQAYGHKILTGRRERFHSIRQEGGLSGFTCREESEYDHFGAGHASTSISSALGIAEGFRHKGVDNLAVAILGDGSLTGGLCYEAMNNAGHIPARNLVVVFNDNDMSIDPNVGALSKFVNHTLTHPSYNRVRKDMKGFLHSLDTHGVPLTGIASKVRMSLKSFFSPGMIFECFGFRYLGPVDGHDIDALIDTLSYIKKEGHLGGPYLVHVLTTKGKGYKLAEENRVKYHGVNPFKAEDGIQNSGVKKLAYQDVFADTLIRMAKEDPRIMAVTAAMPSGTGLVKFQNEFPNRTYDVGIAEAHAVLFAAGLATEGYRPVAAIYSTFLQRAFDQLIHDVGLQSLPVVFALDRAGFVGADGATHQGTYDLTYLRAIPNFVVMAPKDENELQHMLYTAVRHEKGPIAVRYPRGEVVGVKMDAALREIPIGEGELLSSDGEETDILLIGIGYAVQSILEAEKLLRSDGHTVTSINARFAKPLDENLILNWVGRSRLVVTVEENTTFGGFGAAVLELLAKHNIRANVLTLGMPDLFVEHAQPRSQRERFDLDGRGIALQATSRLHQLDTGTPVRPARLDQLLERPLLQ